MHHPEPQRLHALDAVRGFALLLGVAFHAALSFMPGWPPGLWAMVDNSPSRFLADAAFVAHIFRMSLFFLLAGFFARLLHQRLGTAGFWKNRLLRIAVPLVIGWVLLYPLIVWIWIVGIGKTFGGNPPPLHRHATTPSTRSSAEHGKPDSTQARSSTAHDAERASTPAPGTSATTTSANTAAPSASPATDPPADATEPA